MSLRVFVSEYLGSAGRAAPGADSLHAEGLAMLSAVLEDFTRLDGVEAITLVNEDGDRALARHLPRRILDGPEDVCFRELARWADYTLVIAPEFDGLLETRCRWVLEEGGRLLGPAPEAVRLAGDKRRLARHLREQGIPTPRARRCRPQPAADFPLVLKPRHGAGSQATFLVPGSADLAAALAQARREAGADVLVLQEFVPGRPASAAVLIGPGQQLCLPPATQHLSEDGRFRYLGGTVPLPAELAGRAARLARRTTATIPGLVGYAGVDLVLGEATDGSQDQVIEINPRLTTSYVGLRALAQGNLAEAMLRAVRGEALPDLRWRAGAVRFKADGTVLDFRQP